MAGTSSSSSSFSSCSTLSDSSLIHPPTIFHTIRTHSSLVSRHSKDVSINHSKLQSFAESLDIHAILSTDTSKRYDILKFNNIREKFNFICTLDMLEIGSGYRQELHQAGDRGASDSVLFGVMGMFIGGQTLNAEFYANANIISVADAFNLTKYLYNDVPVSEDKPYITQSHPSLIHEFITHIVTILNSVGQKLKELNCDDMYDYIVNYCHHQQASSTKNAKELERGTADRLVSDLYTTFPLAFDDSYTTDEDGIRIDEIKKILLLKKAQLLVYDLYVHFHRDLEAVNFSDISEMTARVDNVIPCVFHAKGVLEYTDELNRQINNLQPVAKRQACELRCNSLIVCHLITQQLNERYSLKTSKAKAETEANVKDEKEDSKGGEKPRNTRITEPQLDSYIWMICGKQPDMRKLPRHIERSLYY